MISSKTLSALHLRSAVHVLTLPTVRCANPRKKRFPKQYTVETVLGRVALADELGAKNDIKRGIVQMSTIMVMSISRGDQIPQRASLTIPAQEDTRAQCPEGPIHSLILIYARRSTGSSAYRAIFLVVSDRLVRGVRSPHIFLRWS